MTSLLASPSQGRRAHRPHPLNRPVRPSHYWGTRRRTRVWHHHALGCPCWWRRQAPSAGYDHRHPRHSHWLLSSRRQGRTPADRCGCSPQAAIGAGWQSSCQCHTGCDVELHLDKGWVGRAAGAERPADEVSELCKHLATFCCITNNRERGKTWHSPVTGHTLVLLPERSRYYRWSGSWRSRSGSFTDSFAPPDTICLTLAVAMPQQLFSSADCWTKFHFLV